MLAVKGHDDITLSNDEIANSPYASLYARINEGPQAYLVLALAEPTSIGNTSTAHRLKWLSSDGVLLTTENGRLVQTRHVPNGNLVESHANTPDPLQLGLHLPSTPLVWQRNIDWQPGYHYGYRLSSEFVAQGQQTIDINGHSTTLSYWQEKVTVTALNLEFTNHFWLEPDSGKVIKSRQTLAPDLPEIEITLLKPFS